MKYEIRRLLDDGNGEDDMFTLLRSGRDGTEADSVILTLITLMLLLLFVLLVLLFPFSAANEGGLGKCKGDDIVGGEPEDATATRTKDEFLLLNDLICSLS